MKDDTVSRASVLKAIDEYERLSMVSQTVRNMTSLREIVQWLPAVQTCEDAVSRADVIELVKDSYYNLAESIEDTWAMVADVEKLPAVQPEPKPDENGSEPFGNAEMLGDRTTDDCISRQAAINALNDEITITGKTNAVIVQDYIRRVNNRLNDLPSAQPEIIHCKECIHKIKNGNHYECNYWDFEDPKDDGFCSFAERRTDG